MPRLANAANQATPTVTATAPANTIQMPGTTNVTTNTNPGPNPVLNLWAKLNTGGKIGFSLALAFAAISILFPAPGSGNIFEDPAGNLFALLFVLVLGTGLGHFMDWLRMRLFVKKA
jgi:hypothetical protein